MGGATIIYKSKGIKKVLTKTKEGTVWVEEKLKPEPEPALKTKRKPEPELKTERKPEPVQKPRKRAAVSPLVGPERLRIADVLELLKENLTALENKYNKYNNNNNEAES